MEVNPAEFSVSASKEDEKTVIEVRGELDVAVSPELEAALAPGGTHDGEPVVLDLTNLTFMDSTGLRILLVTAERFEKSGRSWAIVLPAGSPVRRILSLSETEELLPLETDRRQALASLAEGAE